MAAEAALLHPGAKLFSTISMLAFNKAYLEAQSTCEARNEVKYLEYTISAFEAVLPDFAKKYRGSLLLRNWVERIDGHLHDLEDLLDEFATAELLKQQMEGNKYVDKARESGSKLRLVTFNTSISKRVRAISKDFSNMSENASVILEMLEIYPSIRMPAWWREDPALKLVILECLTLGSCTYVKHLPPLRCLPCLKFLSVYRLNELEYMEEDEFASTTPFFPSLRKLELIQLPKLKGWSKPVNAAKATTSRISPDRPLFPLLEQLVIEATPRPVSMPPAPRLLLLRLKSSHILLVYQLLLTSSYLQDIGIRKCAMTTFPGEGLTFLRELQIGSCPELRYVKVAPDVVKKLIITRCPKMELWAEDRKEEGRSIDWSSFYNLCYLDHDRAPNTGRLPHCLQQRVNLGKLQLGFTYRLDERLVRTERLLCQRCSPLLDVEAGVCSGKMTLRVFQDLSKMMKKTFGTTNITLRDIDLVSMGERMPSSQETTRMKEWIRSLQDATRDSNPFVMAMQCLVDTVRESNPVRMEEQILSLQDEIRESNPVRMEEQILSLQDEIREPNHARLRKELIQIIQDKISWVQALQQDFSSGTEEASNE